MTLALEADALIKRFGGVTALSAGRLHVRRGEVHALLGANGCGKSTLSKIVAGAVAPDAGSIRIEGSEKSFRSPRDAERAGVALFYQELSLIPLMSVEDNLFLGREPRNAMGFVDRKALRCDAQQLIALFAGVADARLAPTAIVASLPPDLRQIVEILKTLSHGPRLMILDEPTAALDARQTHVLFDILRAKKADGVSTIMISHRLDDVFAVADRITVMRNGATVAELATAETDRDSVVRHMIGDAPHAPTARAARSAGRETSPRLSAEGLSGAAIRDVSFTLQPGEILGLGGLQGQGQSALLLSLFASSQLNAGRVSIDGEDVMLRKPADAVRRGVAYVSGDRGRDASLSGRSIFENLVAALLVRERMRFVSPNTLKARMRALVENLKIKFPALDDPIGVLSGGNQQKVFIARWLATAPRVLLLDDPTKGIDLGAKADLFAIIRALADEGASVLLYSSDDSELLEHCGRVLVFNSGRISAELGDATLNQFNLTRAAYGEAA